MAPHITPVSGWIITFSAASYFLHKSLRGFDRNRWIARVSLILWSACMASVVIAPQTSRETLLFALSGVLGVAAVAAYVVAVRWKKASRGPSSGGEGLGRTQ